MPRYILHHPSAAAFADRRNKATGRLPAPCLSPCTALTAKIAGLGLAAALAFALPARAGGIGAQPPEAVAVDGIPSDFQRAQIGKAAYLKTAGRVCGLETEVLVDRFNLSAFKGGGLSNNDVFLATIDAAGELMESARSNKAAYCAEARSRLPGFAAELGK